MSGRRWWLICGLLAVGVTRRLEAQHPIVLKSEVDEYLRLLELEGKVTGPLVFRSPSTLGGLRLAADSNHPWAWRYPLAGAAQRSRRIRVQGLPFADLKVGYNTDHPWGTNDGALWAGRGFSAEVTAGGTQLGWGPLTATLAPVGYYADNRWFTTWPVNVPGYSEYAYPWAPSSIDWPQRPGSERPLVYDWGQSGVRLDLGKFTVGISNENMWWGPAFQRPIVMSNTGPGFPHFDVGIGRPVNIRIGTLETRAVWGLLTESRYFDTVSANNHRLFTGLTVGFRPQGIPGLTLGFTRALYTYWDDSLRVTDFVEVFNPFFVSGTASIRSQIEGDRDQLLSLVARWIFPESGFSAYVEWARNLRAQGFRDFVLEPDHTQGYTVGFEQLLPGQTSRLRLRGEWTHLGRSPTFQGRPTPSFYVHHVIRQGYTQRGQLLGAGIGPGSDSQYLGVDQYHPMGRWGVFVQRVRYNDDAYYRLYGASGGGEGHDVELTLGVSALRFVGRFDLGAGVAASRERNRYFQVGTNVTNVSLGLTIRAR